MKKIFLFLVSMFLVSTVMAGQPGPTNLSNVYDSPDPVNAGELITFYGTGTGDAGGTYDYVMFICDDQGVDCDSRDPYEGRCRGTIFCHSDYTANAQETSCSHDTTGESGTINWYAHTCNTNGNPDDGYEGNPLDYIVIAGPDLCENVTCNDSELTCPDDFIATCENTCNSGTGECSNCTPDCAGHMCAPGQCGNSTRVCDDGYLDSCENTCDPQTGDCTTCEPTCEGHQIQTCFGEPHFCSIFEDKKTCNNHAEGCFWSNRFKFCDGTHNFCPTYSNQLICELHACTWG